MKPEELLQILSVAEKLKCNTRHSYTSSGRHESVAEHSWRLTLMAMLVETEFSHVDMNRVLRMCLIHDLGEAFTGDIPSFEKSDKDEKAEEHALAEWVRTFPEPERSTWEALYAEMNELKTEEAKLYKALDKLEAVISHDEADLSTWLPLEYELQLTYGTENVQFSEYLKALKAEVDKMTRAKIDVGSRN